jgi:hypothetical protein
MGHYCTSCEYFKEERSEALNILTFLAALVIATVIVLSSTSEIFANDTTARVVPGGIEFLKSQDIRILEEFLEISKKSVRVRYRFRNESGQDIHTTVAFPLPPLDCSSPHEWPAQYEKLEKTFKVRVNGRPVSTTTVRKAIIHGRDATAQLRGMGLSDQHIFDQCYGPDKKMDGDLDAAQRAALGKLRQGEWEVIPWEVGVTIFWEQSFPAGKEIVVEHEYAPASGGAYGFFDSESVTRIFDLMSKGSGSEACLDDRTKRAIENRIKAYVSEGTGKSYLTVRDVGYILGTGRNWKGPIGEFTLRVEKETPDEIISLCFPGQPKKISPTAYEFYQKDFVPQDNIVVYFYSAGPLPTNW